MLVKVGHTVQIIHHMRVAYDNDVRFMYKTRCCKKTKKTIKDS